ncbi:MAG: DUF99 family protein [bacterium]
MSSKTYSNVIGVDDAPFDRDHVGKVKVVGAVYANLRLDGVLVGEIEKDGSDAAKKLVTLVGESKFAEHVQLMMLQGITLAGFNVVDAFHIHELLKIPVLIVCRKSADMDAIKTALMSKISDGLKKWDLIQRLGPLEAVGQIFIQAVGLNLPQAAEVVEHFAIHSQIPEPIRTAHLIAGAIADGESRGHP